MRVKIFEDSFPVFDSPANAQNNINEWIAGNAGIVIKGIQIASNNFTKGDTTYHSLITLITYQGPDEK